MSTEKMVLQRQQNQGQQINFLLLQPKNLLQQPNVLLIQLKILLLQQNIYVIPILTHDFVGMTKPTVPLFFVYSYSGRELWADPIVIFLWRSFDRFFAPIFPNPIRVPADCDSAVARLNVRETIDMFLLSCDKTKLWCGSRTLKGPVINAFYLN